MKRLRRIKPPKGGPYYKQVWQVVDGALIDCIKMHPEYFPTGQLTVIRNSIVKRITGAVNAHPKLRPKG